MIELKSDPYRPVICRCAGSMNLKNGKYIGYPNSCMVGRPSHIHGVIIKFTIKQIILRGFETGVFFGA